MWKLISVLIGEIFKFLWENRHDTAEFAEVDKPLRDRVHSGIRNARKRGVLPPSNFHKTRDAGNAGRGHKSKGLRKKH